MTQHTEYKHNVMVVLPAMCEASEHWVHISIHLIHISLCIDLKWSRNSATATYCMYVSLASRCLVGTLKSHHNDESNPHTPLILVAYNRENQVN